MTAPLDHELRPGSAVSADGTDVGYSSIGHGPGLIVVGGVLSSGQSYLPLAERLAGDFEVHLMDRRGRGHSGPQRPGHSIEEECSDLMAVAAATGASAVFGHSFGGLVTLEAARREPNFDLVFVYEPGVELRGRFNLGWLDGYQRLLGRGDRRGAFAWMVKHAGSAPRAIEFMPLWCVRPILRLAIRQHQWAAIEPLLDANLVEHRIVVALDAPSADRFSVITTRTMLFAGANSGGPMGHELVSEVGRQIPNATVAILPNCSHLAPQDQPDEVATAILAHR